MNTHETVKAACGLITSEFANSCSEGNPDLALFVETNLKTVETEMMIAYKREAANMRFEERVEALRKIESFHKKVKGVCPFFNNIAKGANKIAMSHDELFDAVKSNNFSKANLAKEIGDLIEIAKSVKAFKDELTKPS